MCKRSATKKINLSFFIFFMVFSVWSNSLRAQGVGLNTSGAPGDTSAMLDVKSTNKGMLIPRMTTAQRNAIILPAKGLMIYNLDCDNFNYNAGTPALPNWVALNAAITLQAPGPISGSTTVCPSQTGLTYSIAPVPGATTYSWTMPAGATLVSGQGTTSIIVDFGTTSGSICVIAGNACGSSSQTCVLVNVTQTPSSAFTWTPLSPSIGQSTTFTPSISGATYSWTFQNGTPATSNLQNPAVVWNAQGTYDASLTISLNGCTSSSTTQQIVVGNCPHSSQTFSYTGSMQTWTVPTCITSITLDMAGAKGGIGSNSAAAGLGGRVQATLPVTPGNTINIFVGGSGLDDVNGSSALPGGYNGGGIANGEPQYTYYGGGSGGGASDIRIGGTSLNDRKIVAGGGGGGGADGCTANALIGGHGGGTTGLPGGPGNLCSCNPSGQGGTPSAGGAKGDWGCTCNATAGTFGIGGDSNSTGCGGPTGGGGGGGGWYGGGGGGLGGGGGGSSYTDPGATNVTHTQGYQSGNGYVTITW